jgi:hypothetical protein
MASILKIQVRDQVNPYLILNVYAILQKPEEEEPAIYS